MSIVTREISTDDDIIDSRDVIARLAELEEMADDSTENLTDDESRELVALRKLAEDGESPDWHWGVTLIRDSYFTEYARELAEDIGAIDRDAQWPLQYIDWEAAAEALRMDYADVEFDGVTYWAR